MFSKENQCKKEDENELLNQSDTIKSVFIAKNNDVFHFRFFPKFDEYRQKKVFIDCQFNLENEEIYAHRIILSKFSKIFSNYFSIVNDSKNILSVPIPFNINSLFPQMIDFFYKEKLDNDLVFEDPIPLYMMALVYDVPSLSFILNDITNESLNMSNVLSYVSHFKRIRIDPIYSSIFPGISESFKKMIDRSLEFAPFIADHFDEFPIQYLYESLSPQILAEVLIKTDFDDKKRITIIDDFVMHNGDPTDNECKYLHKVINWKSNNSYQLFVDHDANWVFPSIAINPLSTIFDNRRKTINSMIDFLSNHNQKNNNWYLMSWITSIKNSTGDDHLEDCKLIDFASTIGGAISHPINPTLYRFIKTKASNGLQMPQYRELLFDRECYADNTDKYYLSYPYADDNITQFIGYEFELPCYIPKQIIYRPVAGKCYPLVVVGKAFGNDGSLVYCSPYVSVNNSIDEVKIDLNVDKPIKSVIMEMVGNNSGDLNVLRASSLDIIGRFAPS